MKYLKKIGMITVVALSITSMSALACRGSICAVGDGYIVTCDIDTGEFCSIILL